jgi:hypothetical protein
MKNTLIEIQIKEIQDYFINKVVTGDYKVTEFDSHYLKITIDGKYDFCLWTINKAEYFSTYSGSFNFIELPFTEEQKVEAFAKCEEVIAQNWESEIKPQKLKQLEELQKELGISQYSKIK